MTIKDILKATNTIQATNLLGHNLKKVKKNKTKDIVGLGIDNIIGVNMIKLNADLIESI